MDCAFNGPELKDYQNQIQVIKELLGKTCSGNISVTTCLRWGYRKLKMDTGANHPVKDIEKDRTYITVQNHGYVVKKKWLHPDKALITHINLNDNTVEAKIQDIRHNRTILS